MGLFTVVSLVICNVEDAAADCEVDVKPENIVIEDLQNDEPSKALLCDFGLALTLGPGGKLTVDGEPGTLGYQAPEIFHESGSLEYGFGVYVVSPVA
jgi:serine/threonine protein kinase